MMKNVFDHFFSRGEFSERKPNGFTLSEALLSLLCAGIVSLLALCVLQSSVRMLHHTQDAQDQMAVLQIRQIVALTRSCHIEQGKLVFIKGDEQGTISFHKNRLVKQPGYQILLEDLQDAHFEERESGIWLQFNKENKQREVQISELQR